MKNNKQHFWLSWTLLLPTIILLSACNLAVGSLSTATSIPTTGTQIPSTNTTVPPTAFSFPLTATSLPPTVVPPLTLTIDILKNSTYIAPQYNKAITLKDGQYRNDSGVDQLSVTMLPQIAFGDLNEDGIEDAAIMLAENGGGSGVFVSVIAILNQNGMPVQAGAVMIDDRPNIHMITIQDGRIVIEANIHRMTDPMVNPTFPVTEIYQLIQTGLKLVQFTSKTPDGSEKAIIIQNLVSGTQVSGSAQVQGTMPIGPFENNLLYQILDISGNQLVGGAFTVISNGVGGPATFDNTIDIPSLPPGTAIWLELSEKSPADGSLVALDSVLLTIK